MSNENSKITYCRNCGEIVEKNFCSNCGQENKDYIISFKGLFADFLENVIDLDSRLFRTLKFLLLKPGFLTMEYLGGRRVRYVSPLRLYLIASALFFLAVSIKSLIPDVSDFIHKATNEDTLITIMDAEMVSDSTEIISPPTDAIIDTTNNETGLTFKVNNKTIKIEPQEFFNIFVNNIARMMFFLLPLAALLLKMLYIRNKNKKLYIEHLIFALHIHTFIFLILIIGLIFNYPILNCILLLIIIVYIFMAIRMVYKQSKWKTFIKLFLLFISYTFVLMLFLLITTLITILTFFISA